MEKENENKIIYSYRDCIQPLSTYLKMIRKPCYICEKYTENYREKVRGELHLNKEQWKSKKKKKAAAKRQGRAEGGARTMADVTYARIVYRCLDALLRPVPRGKQGTHVSTHCARVTQRRPRVHPRFSTPN